MLTSPVFAPLSFAGDLDIKGISLGVLYSQVKTILPCNHFESDKSDMTKIIFGYSTRCENGRGFLGVNYDQQKNIYMIARRVEFSVPPNIDKIKRRLIEKYKKPNATITNAESEYMCRGDCDKRGNVLDNGENKQSLVISFIVSNNKWEMYSRLFDPLLYERGNQVYNQDVQKQKEHSKSEESDIDL